MPKKTKAPLCKMNITMKNAYVCLRTGRLCERTLDRLQQTSRFLKNELQLIDTLIDRDPHKAGYVDDAIDLSFPGDSLQWFESLIYDLHESVSQACALLKIPHTIDGPPQAFQRVSIETVE